MEPIPWFRKQAFTAMEIMSSECICIVQNTQPTTLFPRIANDNNLITVYQLVEKMDNIFGTLDKYE